MGIALTLGSFDYPTLLNTGRRKGPDLIFEAVTVEERASGPVLVLSQQTGSSAIVRRYFKLEEIEP